MFKKKPLPGHEEPTEIVRVRLPHDEEVFGIVEQRLGGSRMRVRCFDGKSRIVRIPGRLKRSLWVREGDLIIVEPWEFSGDEKGDVVYKYNPAQREFLRKRGHLKAMESYEEF